MERLGPEQEHCELTVDERIDWAMLCVNNEDLDDYMRRTIRIDEIANQAIEDATPDDDEPWVTDDTYVWLEIPIPYVDAETFYAAWWAYSAGTVSAWADLEEGFSNVIDALGMELYGDAGEVEEEEED
jgi:hypothetical protein